jgi:RNA polymerase sigma factor (sigma-70 family)
LERLTGVTTTEAAADVGPVAGQAGRAAEIQALYERRAAQLWAFGRRLGLTADQAEDAVQEAFARLVRTMQLKDGLRQPDPWLFSTVHNLAMDHFRRAGRVRDISISGNERGDLALPGSSGDLDEEALDLWTAVDRLPQRQRAVVYLRYRVDFDFRTIARILSISEVGARASAFRAITRLRREVDR